MFHCFLWLSGF